MPTPLNIAAGAARNPSKFIETMKSVGRWLLGYKKPLTDVSGKIVHNNITGDVVMQSKGLVPWVKDHKVISGLIITPPVLKYGLVEKFSDYATDGKGLGGTVLDTGGKVLAGSENWEDGKQKVAALGKQGEELFAEMQEKFSNMTAGMQNNFSAIMNRAQQQGVWTPEQAYDANMMMAGAQMTGSNGPLRGWGNALGSFLENNTWSLASLLPAGWMLFGRHGLMMKAAGLLLGGWMMNNMNLSMFNNPSRRQNLNQSRPLTQQEFARICQTRGISPQDMMAMTQPVRLPDAEDEKTIVRGRRL